MNFYRNFKIDVLWRVKRLEHSDQKVLKSITFIHKTNMLLILNYIKIY